MNEIKEVMIKALPKIYELYKEIGNECVKEGCNCCPLYNASFPNYKGKTCPVVLISPIYELASEIIKEKRLKEKSNA